MIRTLFVKDLRANREFIWECGLSEDVSDFLSNKLNHSDWELSEELLGFDKGEKVRVGDSVGVVEEIQKTPFLLKERRLVASPRNPIYKVRLGEGIAYVTHNQLRSDIRVIDAINLLLKEENSKTLLDFLGSLIHLTNAKIGFESIEPISSLQVESSSSVEDVRHLYESILRDLDEASIERSLGELDPRERRRVIKTCWESGLVLPQVTKDSGPLGFTGLELSLWKEILGESWESESNAWIEEGFSVTEASFFVQLSRDPAECALMRNSTLTVEDFSHG